MVKKQLVRSLVEISILLVAPGGVFAHQVYYEEAPL